MCTIISGYCLQGNSNEEVRPVPTSLRRNKRLIETEHTSKDGNFSRLEEENRKKKQKSVHAVSLHVSFMNE